MGRTPEDSIQPQPLAFEGSRCPCSVFHHAPDAILLHAQDGQGPVEMNATARTWFGVEDPGADLRAHPNVRDFLARLRDAMPGGEDPTEPLTLERGDGLERFVESRSTPIELGDRPAWMTTLRDVTCRVQQQERTALEQRNAQASIQKRTDYVTAISHELRTPMNGILGMSGLLLDSPLSHEQQEYAETIHSAAETLIRLLNEMLDLSKMEAGRFEVNDAPFSIEQVCRDCVRLLRPRAEEEGTRLDFDVRGALPARVSGDALRLQQVLVNLIGNAVKFTREGSITLRVSCLPAEEGRTRVRFDVEDTGIGIDPELLPRIFDPFSQAKGSSGTAYGGTGLGLAISHRLVELMGGRLQVASTLGVGSTFSFVLECENLDAGPQDPLPTSDVGEVLYVGAYGPIRDAILDALGRRGLKVEVCDLSATALDHVRMRASSGAPFTAVFVERQLPDLDGETLGRSIRNRLRIRDLPLFLVTTPDRRVDAARAERSGFARVIARPEDVETLEWKALASEQSDVGHARPEGVTAVVPAPVPPAATIAVEGGPQAPTVLVVEDNPVNQKVVCHMLRKLGCLVELAEDGRQGVDRLREGHFDLVLMDCQMPVMDGYEATRNIRGLEGRRARVPVVALTANAMEGDREKCLAAGMDDYLSKPAKAEQLRGMLAKWIPEWSERAKDVGVLAGR